MAAEATPSILQPAVVSERISRLKLTNTTLQNHFGMQRGGPAVTPAPMGRRGAFDIFNDTREVGTAHGPGSPAVTIPRQKIGSVNYTIPELNEKLPLLMEELHNMRPIGGPVGQIDAVGERYIVDQERIQAQRVTNLREFQIAAMLRGSYTFTQSGLGFTHAFSGGDFTIDYQIPSGNKTKLNMLGAGDILGASWDNAAAPIITDLFEINAAFINICGRGLSDVWLTSLGWSYVLANTQVLAQAGTVNQVFEFITRDDKDNFTARLKAVPWVTFHITDNGLNLSGTFTKLIEDDHAVFQVSPFPELFGYYECSAPVVEQDGQQAQVVIGEHYWYKTLSDPARYELHSIFNGLPILKVPGATAYGLIKY